MRHASAGAILTIANLCTAAVGLCVGFYAARQLGVEALGGAGVALAIVALLANACDLRLADVATARFYQIEASDVAGRAQLLRSCFTMSLWSGIAITLFSCLALWGTFGLFSNTPVSPWAFALFALSQGFAAPGNFLAGVHRLGDWLRPMVFFQFASSLARAVFVVALLTLSPRIDAYALALAAAEGVSLALAVGIALVVWRRVAPVRELFAVRGQPGQLWRAEKRLLYGSNLMGYTKLLHRAGDLLLVGWFCNDRDTGLYRLARSLFDAAALLYDALARAFQAPLLKWLAEDDAGAYRRTARGLMAFGLIVMLGMSLVSAFAGDWIITRIVGEEFAGTGALLATLSLAMFFVIGVQLWLWPLVLSRGHVPRFALFQGVAVLVGQYALAVVIFQRHSESALAFALGHVFAYILIFVPAYFRVRRRLRAYFPI